MARNSNHKNEDMDWLGKIPDHWDARRLKHITQVRKEYSATGEEELLSVTENRGIVKRREIKSSDEPISRSENLIGYRKVKAGDLISNIMLAWSRGLGVSKYDGVVSPAYSVFSFADDCDSRYFNYLLRSDMYIAEFRRRSKGITMFRLRLYDDAFGRIFVHFPPYEEQKAIADFLDRETARIDNLIDKVNQLENLLDECRESIITKHIESGAEPQKGSKKIKFCCKIDPDILSEDTPPDYSFEYIEIGGVSLTKGVFKSQFLQFANSPSRARKGVATGDIIILTVRTYLKAIAQIGNADHPQVVSTGFCVLRANDEINKDFLYYAVQSARFIMNVERNSTGIAYPSIKSSALGNIKIRIPCIETQREIVKDIAIGIARVDKQKEKLYELKSILVEKRAALITAAVTGQMEVK